MRFVLLLLLFAYGCRAQLPTVPLPQSTPASAAAITPGTLGARYWWVASDNPLNVKVTNWVDRIQSSVLTNATDSLRPTNSSTGVGFNGSSTSLSNLTHFAFTVIGGGTGSVWMVAAPQNSVGSIGGLSGSDNVGGEGIYTTSAHLMKYFGGGGSGTIFSFTPGTTYDVTMVCTNGSTGNNQFYTNGIKVADFAAGSYGNVQWVGQDNEGPAAFYNGKLVELVFFYSNISASVVSQLHTYATNTYGFSP